MKRIFESREFRKYHVLSLTESRSTILESYANSFCTTVFLSHKHDDLEDLKDIIGFFQKEYGVKVYIDSRDPSMPLHTSSETATNIKRRIRQCDKFILLATNGAVESKWCNWELGFGDACKYKQHIAVFPIKPPGSFDYFYKGIEYISIYPHIVFSDGLVKYNDGYLKRGYYVRFVQNNVPSMIPLSDWFMKC